MDEKYKSKARTEEQEDIGLLNRLLGCQTVLGSRAQISRFRIRIGELADLNGEAWVRRNSERLLAQWEKALKLSRQDRKGVE